MTRRVIEALLAAYAAWVCDQLAVGTVHFWLWAAVIAAVAVFLNALWIGSLEAEEGASDLGVPDLDLPRAAFRAATTRSLVFLRNTELLIVLPGLSLIAALGAQSRATSFRVLLFFGPAIACSAVHGFKAIARAG